MCCRGSHGARTEVCETSWFPVAGYPGTGNVFPHEIKKKKERIFRGAFCWALTLNAHILTQKFQSGKDFSVFHGNRRGKDFFTYLLYIVGNKPFVFIFSMRGN